MAKVKLKLKGLPALRAAVEKKIAKDAARGIGVSFGMPMKYLQPSPERGRAPIRTILDRAPDFDNYPEPPMGLIDD